MTTTDMPIMRIGTLYYIPIDAPVGQLLDLSDFSPDDDLVTSDGAVIIDYSTPRQPYSTSGQAYVAVQISFFHNGDALSLEEVADGELQRVYAYLYKKGLVSTMEYPGVESLEPFNLVAQSC